MTKSDVHKSPYNNEGTTHKMPNTCASLFYGNFKMDRTQIFHKNSLDLYWQIKSSHITKYPGIGIRAFKLLQYSGI